MEETVKRSQSLWIGLLLLLGLGLRLTGLWWGQGYFHFGQGDGAQAYSVAVDYSKGEPRAQYIGQPNYNEHSKLPGPLWALFCLLGLKLGKSIDGVIVLGILLNVAAIYLTYLLAHQAVGPPASLWAALFAATLPSPVFYSVGVYNPEVMGFLGACLCLALWQVVRRERSRHIFWLGFLLLMMPQFHMSGLGLWPAVAIVLLLCPVRLNKAWLLGGLLAGTLLYLPYLRGDMAHGWQNTRGMVSGGHGFSWDGLKALSTPLNLLVNFVPQWTRNSSFAEYRELGRACFGWFGLCLAANLFSVVVTAFLVVGAFQQLKSAGAGFWRAPREAFKRNPGILFLAIMLVVPLLCALVIGQPFHARYALVLLPPLLALAGAGAARVAFTKCVGGIQQEQTEETEKEISVPSVSSCSTLDLGRCFTFAALLMTCANIWFMPAFYWHQGAQIEQSAVFVPSFRQLDALYRQLKSHAGPDRPVQVADATYLLSLAPTQKVEHDAWLIRFYVTVREKEIGSPPGGSTRPVLYKLCRAGEVEPGDKRVAYRAHGIALLTEALP